VVFRAPTKRWRLREVLYGCVSRKNIWETAFARQVLL
jgi:hypothetical protein